MTRPALPADEVIKAIEHRTPSRVPMMLHFWTNPDSFGDRAQAVRELQAQYPMDVYTIGLPMPAAWDDPSDYSYHAPGYSWMPGRKPVIQDAQGIDAEAGITDWAQLDAVLAEWPNPSLPGLFDGMQQQIKQEANGRYVLLNWWYCLYERAWSLRGMENLLTDFYEYPDEVHRLLDALTEFYCSMIRRASSELTAHGVFTSDDIGMQTGTMFSPAIFKEFFKPRYARIFQTAHECGLHFWLHTCGNVQAFLPGLIDIGLDVIHPIQKYTMDEREIARDFGGQICFWTGMDVQQILPNGTQDDVRQEVRFMIDTYDRTDGGCMITAGNGVTADVPLENLEAFYDEAYRYGLAHRTR